MERHSRKLLFAAALLMSSAALLLRIRPLDAVRASSLRIAGRLGLRGRDAAAIANAVNAVARRAGFSCLPQAIACEALLRAAGLHCELRIGARQEKDRHAFHAWVESNGSVLIGETAVPHTVLYRPS